MFSPRAKRRLPHRNLRRVKCNHFCKLPVPKQEFQNTSLTPSPAFFNCRVHRAALTVEALLACSHLEFSDTLESLFACGVREESKFVLCVDLWFFPAPSGCKNCAFPMGPSTLIQSPWTLCTRVYIWALCSMPLAYMLVCMQGPHRFGNCSFVVFQNQEV